MAFLNSGETIVRQASVTRINPQGTRDGTLILTNQRLIFEAQVPGGIGAPGMVRTAIDAPLGWVRNAAVSKPLLGKPRLEVELPQQVGLFQLDDADGWYQALSQARAAAPPAPPGGGGMGPGMRPGMGPGMRPGMRPGMGPRRGMGWGGRGPMGGGGMGGGYPPPPAAPAVMLRCRYCGNLNPPTLTKCQSCGAAI